MKVIKLHGCSGAGKTTAVRTLLEHPKLTLVGPKGKPEAYRVQVPGVDGNTYILGSYENTCGGMDTVGSALEVMELIDKYAKMGHVVFEGLLQSTYYGAMGIHSQGYGYRYIYAFLDTPIDVCLERVEIRRAAANNTRKFDPQLTRDKWNTIRRLQAKLTAEGRHTVETIQWSGDVGAQLRELLL